MRASFRHTVLFALGLSALYAAFASAEDVPAAEPAKKPPVRVTISKATTYITEPLRTDGYVDYVAALNQRASRGVTPENNSAVLFLKATGPSWIPKELRETYFKMLGIAPLPEKGDYFVTSEAYIKRQKAANKSGDNPTADDERDPLWDQFKIAIKRPWSKEEFPVWAGWIEANEKPLARLIEASKRPRRYDPMIGDWAIAILLPAVQEHREAVRALVARAMLRVHEGEIDEAWEDLLACHRLARLIGQGETLVESLVATVSDEIVGQADLALLGSARPTAARIAKMREDLRKLSLMPGVADKIDVSERFAYLDSVAVAARGGLSWVVSVGVERNAPYRGAVRSLIDASGAAVDWNAVLRTGNSWYDRTVEACRKLPRSERRKALHEIEQDVRKVEKTVKDLTYLGLTVLSDPRQAVTHWVGRICVTMFLPAIGTCAYVDDRATMTWQLNDLAFALAAYRADHGSYPNELADLVPKYGAGVPKDLFNDGDLHYRQEGGGYLLYSVGANGKDDGGHGFEEGQWADQAGPNGRDDLVIKMPAPN